jgi:hypothetical protein
MNLLFESGGTAVVIDAFCCTSSAQSAAGSNIRLLYVVLLRAILPTSDSAATSANLTFGDISENENLPATRPKVVQRQPYLAADHSVGNPAITAMFNLVVPVVLHILIVFNSLDLVTRTVAHRAASSSDRLYWLHICSIGRY